MRVTQVIAGFLDELRAAAHAAGTDLDNESRPDADDVTPMTEADDALGDAEAVDDPDADAGAR